jgi:hypothetical protein
MPPLTSNRLQMATHRKFDIGVRGRPADDSAVVLKLARERKLLAGLPA